MTAAPATAAASSDAARHDQDATGAAIQRSLAGTRYEVVWREPALRTDSYRPGNGIPALDSEGQYSVTLPVRDLVPTP